MRTDRDIVEDARGTGGRGEKRREMSMTSLHAAAFPKLNQEQTAALARCTGAEVTHYPAGRALFEVGDRDFKFFIVKTGAIAIVNPTADTPNTLVVHGSGEFTGDIAHLTGTPALVSAVAQVDSEVYEVSGAALREALNKCPEVGDIILQAFIARRQLLRESANFTGVRVIGSRYSRDTFRVREFLAKNRMPLTWLDLEDDAQINELLRRLGLSESDTPVVIWRVHVLRNPSNRELAEALGIRRPLEQTVYDLAVVGSGPAGLAAAVYGASEGLNTLVLERTAPGGQASSSMRIENYLGFPTGLTGAELAERAVVQAHKFGACLSLPSPVTGLGFDNGYSTLRLEGGETVAARCLLVATGADYRTLDVPGCERFNGCGVYYAATPIEAEVCQRKDVIVVGGGNSAGQAALFLAGRARKVFLILRGDSLDQSMSSYLARRIEQTPNIEVVYHTTIKWMAGDKHLSAVEIVNSLTGEERTLETPAVFSFIGAVPRTDWLPPEIERDDKGFVRTGAVLAESSPWTARRQPFLLETSRPGVFAAGDVRSGSIKRVASAVGEGAMAVRFVHEHLKQT